MKVNSIGAGINNISLAMHAFERFFFLPERNKKSFKCMHAKDINDLSNHKSI